MRLTATLLLTVIYSFSNAQNWSPVTVFPGPEVTYRRGGISVSIGNKGYIGLGLSGTILKDFWEFNALTNTWTRLPDFLLNLQQPLRVKYLQQSYLINLIQNYATKQVKMGELFLTFVAFQKKFIFSI